MRHDLAMTEGQRERRWWLQLRGRPPGRRVRSPRWLWIASLAGCVVWSVLNLVEGSTIATAVSLALLVLLMLMAPAYGFGPRWAKHSRIWRWLYGGHTYE
jgi:Flp pilus assembly protein TadB